MSRIFYTADLHFGHRLVSGLRGFADPADHDAAIVDAWKSAVKPNDTVIVAGDLAISRHHDVYALIGSLPGTKILVSGNHDPSHPMHRGAIRATRDALTVFDHVTPFLVRRTSIGKVAVSHFPYTGDHGPDRFVEYRLRDGGMPLVHGHTHGVETVTRTVLGTVQVHVGVDAWGMQFVPEETVVDLIRSA